MASAQVLSKPAASSRKKKDLEAGRRLLEEFRKKKGVAKKEAPTSQPRSNDATPNEKQISDNGPMLSVNSGNGSSDIVTRTSAVSDHNDKTHVSIQHNGPDSVPQAHLGTRNNDHSSPDVLQTLPKQVQNTYMSPASNFQPASDFAQQSDYSVRDIEAAKVDDRYADAMSSDRPSVSQVYGNSDSHSKWYGSDKDFSSSGSFPSTYATANDVAAKFHIEGRVSNVLHQQSDSLYSSTDLRASASDVGHGHLDLKNNHFGLEDRKPSNAVGNSMGFRSPQASEPHTIDFNSNSGGLFNGPSYSAVADPFPKRSRPSFLDSIVKDSSVSGRPFVERDNPTSSMFSSSNVVTSSAIHNPPTVSSTSVEPLLTPAYSTPSDNFSSNASKGYKSFEHDLESRLEFTSQKQNEDFAALEQYIEDLTQEKFSLQRTLEASKSLTESLAAENSSLTESYNQQASIVNQLKDEMERLQDEIKARLVELEAIKAEYMNAQLECNAADERAKLLASEVISLEEKALRLRSNELKLERELENSNAEIASYKKKISSLDKERRDLLQTIDALQEEKKLMQSKLRRASTSGISIDLNNGHTKTDASTSTTDLEFDTSGNSSEQASSNMQMLDNVDNFQLLQNNFAGHEDFSMSIPPDQVQMIQNINSLITEILSEKDELMQALITEVSKSTKLKESNKELSQKLEVQTQRLELLTSQSMASEHVATKQPASSHIVRESVTYADEGDEVVERVLGWIMKLFPGGPSKRRSSRL